jgi:DNA-binding transcriptional LysR family regulator
MITTDDLIFFQVLARSPSLAEAARSLNVTAPAVTQRLRALEARVGVRLVDRNSRGLSLTDEGTDRFGRAGDHRRHRGSGREARLAHQPDPWAFARGRPYGFGRRYVSPVVESFAKAHPATTVTLELSDSPIRQVNESWDIVVHIGALPESDRLVTTLAPNRRILCAAPAYLESSPPLATPHDLVDHRCLALRENNEDVTLWRLRHEGKEPTTVRIKPAMSSNDGEIVRDWALAGLGVMVRSEWDVAGDLAAGRLVEILPGWALPCADVVALVHARNGRSGRASAFLDDLRNALTKVPWRS